MHVACQAKIYDIFQIGAFGACCATKKVAARMFWTWSRPMSRRKRPTGLVLDPTYLLEWRKFRDLSLEDVGKLMGIDKTAISRIERGLTPYDQIHLQQMSEIYRATIPDLLYTDPRRQTQPNQFGMVGFQNVPQGDKKVRRRTPADELAETFAKLKFPEEIDAVKTIIEALAAKRKKGD
jgi:transcriptional regulator with XRE-family HTH domain